MVTGKKVLLYSGGMDSVIADYLFEPDVCLFIKHCATYSFKEDLNLLSPAKGELIVSSDLRLAHWEIPNNGILPMRNAYFILLAANYGDDILLGATYGDRSSDKDPAFAELMRQLLDYMWKPQHWTEGRNIQVRLPLKKWTKADLVLRYLNRGGDPERLLKSVSCYHPYIVQCGECKPCARKWTALKYAELYGAALPEFASMFEKNPADYFTLEMIDAMEKGEWRGPTEDEQTLEVLRRCE